MIDGPSIAEMLAQSVGFDPAVLGARQVDRAVQRRMVQLALDDSLQYHRQLQDRPEELALLAEELTVPETCFFRDPAAFEALARRAAEWASQPARPPLRILNLACATGEEAYSAAITLLEAGLSGDRFTVLGVDLSERSLAIARQGRFTQRSLHGLAPELLRRYFRRDHDRYALSATARSPVRFVQGNLNAPGLLAGEPRFDVVFCCNVLIYLTEQARARVAGHLRRLVGPGGTVLLGHADPGAVLGPEFEPAGGFAFSRRSPAPSRPPTTSIPDAPPSGGRHASKAIHTPQRPTAGGAEVAPSPSSLALAADRADRGEYAEAARLCQQVLRRAGPSARAYHLLGVIARAQGDDRRAEHWLSRAVYLDARDDLSLLALSLLARKRGDLPAAARYRRRAERARQAREAR